MRSKRVLDKAIRMCDKFTVWEYEAWDKNGKIVEVKVEVPESIDKKGEDAVWRFIKKHAKSKGLEAFSF